MTAAPAIMAFGPTESCGCVMEKWLYIGIELHMHFESTGEVDCYFDGGEWDREITFYSRQYAFDWVTALPMEGTLPEVRARPSIHHSKEI